MTSEPDMEGLLASIRKAINTDMGINSPLADTSIDSAPTLRGTMRDLRIKFDSDISKNAGSAAEISELRNKINRNRNVDGILQPAYRFDSRAEATVSRKGFEAILAGDLSARQPAFQPEPVESPQLRPTFYESETVEPNYPVDEEAQLYQADPAWDGDGQSYLPAVQYDDPSEDYLAPALLSDETSDAANQSFNQLADTLMARALGERSIEDMTHDLLRGMLKNWLDTNLPSLVERLVREEIERVARRGR